VKSSLALSLVVPAKTALAAVESETFTEVTLGVSGAAWPPALLLIDAVETCFCAPADAVSVPTDCSFQKLRVSKYRVLSDITAERKEIPDAVYNGSDDWDDTCECDGDCDTCDYDSDESDDSDNTEQYDNTYDPFYDQFVRLKIRNYIDGKHANGVYPTVKQIQSRMKDYDLSVDQILDIATRKLTFNSTNLYDADGNPVPISQIQIVPSF